MGFTRCRMPRVFIVKLDLARLRANLSAQEGRPVQQHEVEQWLTDAGFRWHDDARWRIEEPHLGQLHGSEVVEAEIVDETDDPPAAD